MSKSETVPITNADARLYQLLAYSSPPGDGKCVQACSTDCVLLMPGLNYVSAEFLRRAKTQFTDDGRVHGYDALRAEDPLALSEHAAKQLAHNTASPPMLRQWLKDEKRAPVRAAIEARLAPKPKELNE